MEFWVGGPFDFIVNQCPKKISQLQIGHHTILLDLFVQQNFLIWTLGLTIAEMTIFVFTHYLCTFPLGNDLWIIGVCKGIDNSSIICFMTS